MTQLDCGDIETRRRFQVANKGKAKKPIIVYALGNMESDLLKIERMTVQVPALKSDANCPNLKSGQCD